MGSLGKLPENISLLHAMDSIGENIIIADLEYNIKWMNQQAVILFTQIAPLYHIEDPAEMIGMNMKRFHRNPPHQENVMSTLSAQHRTRITIKDNVVADIVVTSILGTDNEKEGYIVMLQDVTTRAEEEKRREKMIEELSIPILHIWEKTIALPLIGNFTKERGSALVSRLLKECTEKEIEYVLLALNEIEEYDDALQYSLQHVYDCLKLVGTECIIVGIKPKLAMTFRTINNDIRTFRTSHQGLQYIIGEGQRK